MNPTPNDHDDNETQSKKRRRLSSLSQQEGISDVPISSGLHGESYGRAAFDMSPNKNGAAWKPSGQQTTEKLEIGETNYAQHINTGQKASGLERSRSPEEKSEEKSEPEQPKSKTGTSDTGNVSKTKSEPLWSKTFPGRLHELLASADIQEIVCWLPEGDSFVIKSRKRFVQEVLPKYYKEAKFESFTRKLNRWGFRRISSNLYPNDTVYFHRLFKRDTPDLCKDMSGAKKQDETMYVTRDPDTVHGISVGNQAVGREVHPLVGARPQVLPQYSQSQPLLSPLERHLLEQQVFAGQATALGSINDRLRRIQVLKAEMEARHRALALLQSPLRSPATPDPNALGRFYGLASDATGLAQLQQRSQSITDGMDAQALLLHQRQAEVNNRFFRLVSQPGTEPPDLEPNQSESVQFRRQPGSES